MPPKKDTRPHQFNELVFFLLGLFLLVLIWNRLSDYFNYYHWGDLWQAIVDFFSRYIWPIIIILGAIIGVASICGIVYHSHKLRLLNLEEKLIYGVGDKEIPLGEEIVEKNEKWEHVISKINSSHSADWRQAIIDADIMLEELLKRMGYQGDGVGEMLKGVEKSDFLTLDAAWGAHKVRNAIAHEGSDFQLNEREAKQAIAQFESVFKEFKII